MKASIALCALLLSTLSGCDLMWAPMRTLRKPFLTFLNDVHNPSFMSTHYNTHKQETSYMSLPRNNFFGLICGACFSSRSRRYSSNLTMSIFSDNSFISDNKMYWSKNRFNQCLVVYMITHIEEESGNLTCVLQLGVRTFKHILRAKASYYTDAGRVTRVDRNMSDYSILDCDEKKNDTTLQRMTIWWYESQDGLSITPAYISKETLFPKHPPPNVNVACATFYGISQVSRVYQQRYYYKYWAGGTPSYFSPSTASHYGLLMRIWENCLMAALISFL